MAAQLYKKICWMHDLSDRASVCADAVAVFAGLGASVSVVHALGRTMDTKPTEEGRSASSRSAEAIKSQRAMDHLRALRGELSVPVAEVRILSGSALEAAEIMVAEGADLTIIGASGVVGLVDRVLIGSTSRKLVRDCSSSVLVGRPMSGLRSILCPVDLEKPCSEPMLRAWKLAEATGCAVNFLHVVEAGTGGEDLLEARGLVRRVVGAELGADWPENWRVEAIIAETAVAGVAAAADRHDLVVLGTKKRSRLGRVLLGSVAESTLVQCSVSVLVCR